MSFYFILIVVTCVNWVSAILDQGASLGINIPLNSTDNITLDASSSVTLTPTTPVVPSITQALREETECPFGLYGSQEESCICLTTGLWGIYMDYCSVPIAWVGVSPHSEYCLPNQYELKVKLLQKALTLGTPEVAQLSKSMQKLIDRFDRFTSEPFIEDVYQFQSNLLSFGESGWKLTTVENETFCLAHGTNLSNSHFCVFDQLTQAEKILKIRSITPSCSEDLPKIVPTQCNAVFGNRTCKEATDQMNILTSNGPIIPVINDTPASIPFTNPQLGLFGESLVLSPMNPEDEDFDKNLVKRVVTSSDSGADEAPSPPTTSIDAPAARKASTNSANLLDENEDQVKSGEEEIGHKLMRDQIDQYVDVVVAQLTGLADSSGSAQQGSQARLPVLKVLNLIKLIMQRTCVAVKEEYFELALNTFLKVQLESFHVKEPYVMHNVFVRIEYALKNCYNNAKAHVFAKEGTKNFDDNSLIISDANSSDTKVCPDVKWEGTSDNLDVHGDNTEIVKLASTPQWGTGLLDGNASREPLIETVWKMLVNAHSYCYPYFKEYFNDHHALTVSLLPLFNNQIQDIWLKEGGYDTSKGKLYGNLLGDISKVLGDVDHCVAASRYLSQYPWYMNRPIKDTNNKWRKRRKRDVGSIEDEAPTPTFVRNGQMLCLFDPDDPVAYLGKPVCTS